MFTVFYEVMKGTNSTRLRMFHYKIVNRIITTNIFLKIIKIREDDRCTFCEQEPETIAHVFWYCRKVQDFINNVRAGMRSQHHFNLSVNLEKWFFLTDLSPIEALMCTLAKLVIYEARLKESLPNCTFFNNKLKNEAVIESTAARLSNKPEAYETKWGVLKRIYM